MITRNSKSVMVKIKEAVAEHTLRTEQLSDDLYEMARAEYNVAAERAVASVRVIGKRLTGEDPKDRRRREMLGPRYHVLSHDTLAHKRGKYVSIREVYDAMYSKRRAGEVRAPAEEIVHDSSDAEEESDEEADAICEEVGNIC